MGPNDTTARVEHHLEMMANTPVGDEATARQALAYALSAVGGMNQHLGAAQQPAALPGPVDGIIDKLEDWIKRLVAKLTEIARQLEASFSITVGTTVSVTIICGPFH